VKSLLSILALAGIVLLGSTVADQWTGGSAALAQSKKSSACFQNCTNVRNWPAAQCRAYCKGKR
jgi:hypothetical protein